MYVAGAAQMTVFWALASCRIISLFPFLEKERGNTVLKNVRRNSSPPAWYKNPDGYNLNSYLPSHFYMEVKVEQQRQR
jgi:hypothetical protein